MAKTPTVKLCAKCAPLVERFAKLHEIKRGLCPRCKCLVALATAQAKRPLVGRRGRLI